MTTTDQENTMSESVGSNPHRVRMIHRITRAPGPWHIDVPSLRSIQFSPASALCGVSLYRANARDRQLAPLARDVDGARCAICERRARQKATR